MKILIAIILLTVTDIRTTEDSATARRGAASESPEDH